MANYVDRISLNGNTADIIGISNDGYYPGVDLTVKHAEEIASYDNVWAWIKARITAGNYAEIHVADYIPFTTSNNRVFNAQVAGINPYTGYGATELGNHIDFVTRELWPETFQMNLIAINNGTSETLKDPWCASNGYLFVNSLAGQVPNSTTKPFEMVDKDYTADGIYYYLPDALKSVIADKLIYTQTRYHESNVLSTDNEKQWTNVGKLWLPAEFEVMGAKIMTTTGWTAGNEIQYPLFAHNMNRVKRVQGGNLRSYWWLASASGSTTSGFVAVSHNGCAYANNASGAYRAPICFRISG